MNLTCPRCQTTNPSDALYCKNCGTAFRVQPIRKNSISTPVFIIVAICAVCGFCGLFGLLSSNRKTEVAKPSDSIAANSPVNSSEDTLRARNLVDASDTANAEKTKSSKSATVISRNANLREAASSNGAIIQTLPEDSVVEVIRQEGAWFYVSAGGRAGWMHGNTIRLAGGYSNDEQPTTSGNSSQTIRSPKSPTTESSAESDDTEITSGSSHYITGPRGGCYYINGNGNKTYVSRSLCGGGNGTSYQKSPSSSSSSSGGYIRGPRGGCFYYTASGRKQYVDRSLCN